MFKRFAVVEPVTERLPPMVWESATVRPWNVEDAEVDVAMNCGAVTGPVNTPAPVTERAVPGVVVPIPTLPCSSILTRSVNDPVTFLVRKER